MDEVYRGYRIAVSRGHAGWTARITHVRGPLAPLGARSSCGEGAPACLARARAEIDRYMAFLAGGHRVDNP